MFAQSHATTVQRRAIAFALCLCMAAPALPQNAPLPAPLPDLGDASESTLSRAAERALGRETMRSARAQGAVLDDPEVNDYLQTLGQRLVAADPTINEKFEFFAVGASEINAFALPGGHVGVNTGLILAAQSESELASVLAHEISHVSQHHIARQYAAQTRAGYASLAAMLLAIIAGGRGDVAIAAITGTNAAQAQAAINYTREHEHEADRVGFTLLERAGFDPRAMASFFERLQQQTRVLDGNAPVWLRTHPLTQTRIAEAQDRAFDKTYRQVPDSQEFQMVRALLRSYEGDAAQAVARLAAELKEGRYRDRTAARYGHAAALLRAKDLVRAKTEVDTLERDGMRHPMIEALSGLILQQSRDYAGAIARYEAALKRYPDHLQLVYDYPRTLLLAGDPARAVRFAEDRLLRRTDDGDLHQMAAEGYAALGQPMQSHYHQGEYYAAQGNTKGAIEQLELATRMRGGDYRVMLIAESRLRELREQQREILKTGRASASAAISARSPSLRAFTRD